jgi:hypothetical protein
LQLLLLRAEDLVEHLKLLTWLVLEVLEEVSNQDLTAQQVQPTQQAPQIKVFKEAQHLPLLQIKEMPLVVAVLEVLVLIEVAVLLLVDQLVETQLLLALLELLLKGPLVVAVVDTLPSHEAPPMFLEVLAVV